LNVIPEALKTLLAGLPQLGQVTCGWADMGCSTSNVVPHEVQQ
jgi:hypothetical protein